MTTDVRRLVRYQNTAHALRAVAEDYSDAAIRSELLKLAENYEQLAGALENLIRSKLLLANAGRARDRFEEPIHLHER